MSGTRDREARDLLTRLEAAAFGSWELDEAIAQAIGVKSLGQVTTLVDPFGKSDATITRPSYLLYTTSIDAALMLVPKGCWWATGWCGGKFYGSLIGDGVHKYELAATAPLALCVAALKVRDRQPEGRDDRSA